MLVGFWLAFFYVYIMKNPYVVFVIVLALLLTFFYFYSVELFQAEITENGMSFIKDVSLKQFFESKPIPDDYAIEPTLQGWLLLCAIFLGLPIMIAYRVTLKRYPRRAEK